MTSAAPIQSADLSGIIERLEKATGPSRYDDCHLWVVAKGGDARMVVCDSSEKSFVWERGIDGMWIRAVVEFSEVPKYTASVDAAIALAERVLPGWTIASIGQDDRKGWHTELRQGYRTSYSTVALGGALAPAIAICLATLRALQSKGEA